VVYFGIENNCMTTREKALCDASNPCQNDGVCYVVDMNGTAVQQCNCSLPLEETPVWKVSTSVYTMSVSRVEYHQGLHPIGRLPPIWGGWNPNQKVCLPLMQKVSSELVTIGPTVTWCCFPLQFCSHISSGASNHTHEPEWTHSLS